MDLNYAATASSLCVGIGFQQMKEFFAGFNVNCFCDKTYKSYQDLLHLELSKAAHDIMRINGEKSRNRAKEKGNVSATNITFITATGDASYPIRSYGNNYKSPAGTVSVFDAESGDILFVLIYNSYCYTCTKAANKGVKPPKHNCYKNWDLATPITAIEAHGMVQAFTKSIPSHGIIIKTIVTDEDSSIYSAIRNKHPYREHKIEPERKLCTNHLRKNFEKKLRAASLTTQPRGQRIPGFVKMRNLLKEKKKDIKARVEELIQKRLGQSLSFDEKVKALEKDILNVASHVFGEHRSCQARGDTCKPNFINSNARGLRAVGLYQKVTDALAHLAKHSDSLLFGATTNVTEQFHSLICHYLGGKRSNCCLTNLYFIKVYIAVLQHSSGACLMTLYSYMHKKCPRILLNVTQERLRKNSQTKERRATQGRKKHRVAKGAEKYYGPSHQNPDMPLHKFEEAKQNFIKELKTNQENRHQIERDTVGQYKCPLWRVIRRDLLTASNFRTACQWSITTSCTNRIKKIMYPPVEDNEWLSYGREQEEICKQKLSKMFDDEIKPCGLFIDSKHEMLGCTADVLIGEKSCAEIKCPYSAANMTAEEAIRKDPNTRKMFDRKDITKINKNHEVYYQIQGQLHILQLDHAWLVIHTPLSREKFKITVDHAFWEKKMEKQLLRFYNDCMLPEMIDSRHNRKMPIRNPQYTLEAIEMKKKNKKKLDTESPPEVKKRPTASVMETEERIASVESLSEKITDDDSKRCKKRKTEMVYKMFSREFIEMQKMLWAQRKKSVPVGGKKKSWLEILSENLRNPNRNAMSDEQIQKFRDIYDHREILPQNVAQNVSSGAWLDDDSLDAFLRVLKWSHDDVITQSPLYQYFGPDRGIEPIKDNTSIQIIGGLCINHWRCLYYDKEKLHIYDSAYWNEPRARLSEIEMRYVNLRFPSVDRRNIIFEKLLFTQPDGDTCGAYAAAFAESLSRGIDPSTIKYSLDTVRIREHFVEIVYVGQTSPFPLQDD